MSLYLLTAAALFFRYGTEVNFTMYSYVGRSSTVYWLKY